ncbi:MAG TPA: MBL fold metallo-hydrolase, partial [Kofleriaceae bacterium]|nr:MBL fold metallo-hydrolase [Kofleriaceae bacterium]
MRVVSVPCLKDNYAYLVIDGDRAAVVDPGEAAPVEQALAREGVTLAAIWLTHHHADHVGGVKELAAARP